MYVLDINYKMDFYFLDNINMKKCMKIAFVAAFAAIAGYDFYTSQKSETMSDLALANVEALASGESGKDIYCCGNYGTCMEVIDSDGIKHKVKGFKSPIPCP